MGRLSRLWGRRSNGGSTAAAPGGLILLYHRVAAPEFDPWGICVTPSHFEEQVQMLTDMGVCSRIRDLVEALEAGTGPVFAVTFDDGYADNAGVAAPILARHQVPATFFAVSDAIGSPTEFWWDALERVFLSPGVLPRCLRMSIDDRLLKWDLGADAHYSATSFRANAAWNAERDRAPTARHDVFRAVWSVLAEQSPTARQELVSRISAWAQSESAARPECAVLSRHQLEALAANPLFEVGAHTRTHPWLPTLSFAEQVDEVCGSRSALERIIGQPVVSFSYPFGRLDAMTERIVQDAGYTTACTSRRAAVSRGVNPLRLPRLPIHDCDSATFRRVVMDFLEAV